MNAELLSKVSMIAIGAVAAASLIFILVLLIKAFQKTTGVFTGKSRKPVKRNMEPDPLDLPPMRDFDVTADMSKMSPEELRVELGEEHVPETLQVFTLEREITYIHSQEYIDDLDR